MSECFENKYFAASNSAVGFQNYYGDIFSRARCRRLYVIKGGPGTGKSRFMRDVAQYAVSLGEDVTYYYCSSDPESLDGIFLEQSRIGLVDATAPHVWEPSLVGAFEQIVDLGVFWDARALAECRADIERLGAEKARGFSAVYAYLRAIGEVERAIEPYVLAAVNREKLKKKAARFAGSIAAGDAREREVVLCASVGMKGEVRFDTYEQRARRLYRVNDHASLGHLYLEAILDEAQKKSAPVRVSFDPVFPARVDALELTASGEVFVLVADGEACDINIKRFADADRLRASRRARRQAAAQKRSLMESVGEMFGKIREYHFALEEIFGATMDFEAKEGFTAEFCRRLF